MRFGGGFRIFQREGRVDHGEPIKGSEGGTFGGVQPWWWRVPDGGYGLRPLKLKAFLSIFIQKGSQWYKNLNDSSPPVRGRLLLAATTIQPLVLVMGRVGEAAARFAHTWIRH